MIILERLETQVKIKQAELPFAFFVVGKQHFSEKLKFQCKKEVLNIYVALGKNRVAAPINNTLTNYKYLKIKPTFHRKTTLHNDLLLLCQIYLEHLYEL